MSIKKDKVYVTVLSTDEYLVGTITLNKSLKLVKSEYDLVVLISKCISEKSRTVLRQNNIEFIETDSVEVPQWIKEDNEVNWNYTFDKLKIFELTQYQKIVYLDSDMYVRRNIDELFLKPHMSAAVDIHHAISVRDEYQKLTSGILVLEPKKGIIKKFIEILNNPELSRQYKQIGDQDIIQLYDTQWENKKELHLSTKYNMFFTSLDYYINKNYFSLDEICVIHFIMTKKPWCFEKDKMLTEYVDWVDDTIRKECIERGRKEDLENLKFGKENKIIIMKEYTKLLLEAMNEIDKTNE